MQRMLQVSLNFRIKLQRRHLSTRAVQYSAVHVHCSQPLRFSSQVQLLQLVVRINLQRNFRLAFECDDVIRRVPVSRKQRAAESREQQAKRARQQKQRAAGCRTKRSLLGCFVSPSNGRVASFPPRSEGGDGGRRNPPSVRELIFGWKGVTELSS